MVSKSKIDTKEMFSLLTEETRNILESFLKHYSKLSVSQYKSAISLMFYELGKDDVKKLNIVDYNKAKEYFLSKDSEGSQVAYIESFFKYLYWKKILECDDGFDGLWLIKDIGKHFSNPRTTRVKPPYKPALTLEEITKIDDLMKLDYENYDMMKISFYWHMIFYEDCAINELTKEIDVSSFRGSQIITKENNIYNLPPKFNEYVSIVKTKNRTGYNSINSEIQKLGSLVGLKKLTPQMIISAKKENTITCSNCGESYLNFNSNWLSVNNRIVCINCAEQLKKNCKVDLIENITLEEENITENINISSIIFTFDELKKKLNINIDYLKLHEFQIQIGKLGEAFVYDQEKLKLLSTKYEDMIDNTFSLNPENGFDIFSYERNGIELYIEVKTSVGTDNEFYISDHELKIAKELLSQNKRYVIYRVTNILAKDKNDIKIDKVYDIFDSEKYAIIANEYKVFQKGGELI